MIDIDKLKEAIEILAEVACNNINIETPNLVTPPGIKFLVEKTGKVTGLYFNEGKQVLQYCTLTGQFEVQGVYESDDSLVYTWPMTECLPLTPCDYVDLELGAFFSAKDNPVMSNIYINLPEKKTRHCNVRVFLDEDTVICYGPFNRVWKIGR